jgi:hypothetical protein
LKGRHFLLVHFASFKYVFQDYNYPLRHELLTTKPFDY